MIRFFAGHPTAANLMMAALIAAGLLTIGQLRRETFPDFAPREVAIVIAYPGATAEDVENAVCRRVEDGLDGVRFVQELRCDAGEGLAVITVKMDDRGDFTAFKDEIETEINAIDDFPDQVEEPFVKQLGVTEPVLALLVSGPLS
ncbi:MAG: efflux RND transporter permease subunit, partial [Planctomycetales bacterium]